MNEHALSRIVPFSSMGGATASCRCGERYKADTSLEIRGAHESHLATTRQAVTRDGAPAGTDERESAAYWAIHAYLDAFYTIHNDRTQVDAVDAEVEALIDAMIDAADRVQVGDPAIDNAGPCAKCGNHVPVRENSILFRGQRIHTECYKSLTFGADE